jgi:hypothetical protein
MAAMTNLQQIANPTGKSSDLLGKFSSIGNKVVTS